jgi:ribosomal protein S18 acetylase RimI-like enzyme
MPPTTTEVRPFDQDSDAEWRDAHLRDHWGGPLQARRGELLDVRGLPALVAERDGAQVGLLCYRDDGAGWWELALISAVAEHEGVGSALVADLVERVGPGGRIWVVTTNDNVDALRFYQRRGFRLRAFRIGAVDEARRKLKPEIPVSGRYGIPLRDEVELELLL